MKMTDFVLLAASAAAVYLVMAAKKPAAAGASSSWSPWSSVANYDGYQYFNDGSSGLVITPAGEYVLNGVTVWSPNRMF